MSDTDPAPRVDLDEGDRVIRHELAEDATQWLRDNWTDLRDELRANRAALERVKTLRDEWRRCCTCDPSPEGQHREDCLTHDANHLARALEGPTDA